MGGRRGHELRRATRVTRRAVFKNLFRTAPSRVATCGLVCGCAAPNKHGPRPPSCVQRAQRSCGAAPAQRRLPQRPALNPPGGGRPGGGTCKVLLPDTARTGAAPTRHSLGWRCAAERPRGAHPDGTDRRRRSRARARRELMVLHPRPTPRFLNCTPFGRVGARSARARFAGRSGGRYSFPALTARGSAGRPRPRRPRSQLRGRVRGGGALNGRTDAPRRYGRLARPETLLHGVRVACEPRAGPCLHGRQDA